jgi:hypothetical protein
MPPRAYPARRSPSGFGNSGNAGKDKPKKEPKILFQQFFKSVGPRTYVAQVKEAGNGNHFVVLTEGKRDDKTAEVRKSRLFIYSEDFVSFFKMLQAMAQFIKANPLDPKVKAKRDRFWAKQPADQAKSTAMPPTVSPTPTAAAV